MSRNKVLITPELGARVRHRGMLLEDKLTPTGPVTFDPCAGCAEFCRKACPQAALARTVLSPAEAGMDTLPGRDGHFGIARCSIQRGKDVEEADMSVAKGFLSGLNKPAHRLPGLVV